MFEATSLGADTVLSPLRYVLLELPTALRPSIFEHSAEIFILSSSSLRLEHARQSTRSNTRTHANTRSSLSLSRPAFEAHTRRTVAAKEKRAAVRGPPSASPCPFRAPPPSLAPRLGLTLQAWLVLKRKVRRLLSVIASPPLLPFLHSCYAKISGRKCLSRFKVKKEKRDPTDSSLSSPSEREGQKSFSGEGDDETGERTTASSIGAAAPSSPAFAPLSRRPNEALRSE